MHPPVCGPRAWALLSGRSLTHSFGSRFWEQASSQGLHENCFLRAQLPAGSDGRVYPEHGRPGFGPWVPSSGTPGSGAPLLTLRRRWTPPRDPLRTRSLTPLCGHPVLSLCHEQSLLPSVSLSSEIPTVLNPGLWCRSGRISRVETPPLFVGKRVQVSSLTYLCVCVRV